MHYFDIYLLWLAILDSTCTDILLLMFALGRQQTYSRRPFCSSCMSLLGLTSLASLHLTSLASLQLTSSKSSSFGKDGILVLGGGWLGLLGSAGTSGGLLFLPSYRHHRPLGGWGAARRCNRGALSDLVCYIFICLLDIRFRMLGWLSLALCCFLSVSSHF